MDHDSINENLNNVNKSTTRAILTTPRPFIPQDPHLLFLPSSFPSFSSIHLNMPAIIVIEVYDDERCLDMLQVEIPIGAVFTGENMSWNIAYLKYNGFNKTRTFLNNWRNQCRRVRVYCHALL